MASFETVNILGVQVACLSAGDLLSTAIAWSQDQQPRSIFYVNAHCLNTAYTDQSYRSTLEHASLVYADGISVEWSSRFLGGCHLKKLTGADWISDFCHMASEAGIRIYLLCGKPSVAQSAANYLQNNFPGLEIVGFSDGYFREKSETAVLAEIRSLKPNVLFVGMGIPLQEKWLAENMTQLETPLNWAVGGLFDYYAGNLKRSPTWMRKFGLEWLWILGMQPRKKWRRYLLGNPQFVLRVLRQRLDLR